MKSLKSFSILAFLLSYTSFAQICGTSDLPHVQISHLDNNNFYRSLNANTNAQESEGSSSVCINIFFHIVRNTNGSFDFNMPDLEAITQHLNEIYTPYNIIINNLGHDFINKSNLLVLEEKSEFKELVKENNLSNAINFYIVNSLWDTDNINNEISGVAEVLSKNIAIRSDYVLQSTAPHELGHCLGLYHTHETRFGIEKINGSNCQNAGDLICDTPADPDLSDPENHVNVGIFCEFKGDNRYNPLTNNLMSYTREHCATSFTPIQVKKMIWNINNKNEIKNIRAYNCSSITEINQICNGYVKTISLLNSRSNNTKWTTSGNFQTISHNNDEIKITTNNKDKKNGWVRANLNNGIQLTEYFGVNKKQNERPLEIKVHRPNNYSLSAWTTHGSGISPYKWYINGIYMKTTSANSTSFAYEHNSGRIEVRNPSSCNEEDTSFYTGFFGNSTNYYNLSPNPANLILKLSLTNEGQYLSHHRLLNLEQDIRHYNIFNTQFSLVASGILRLSTEIINLNHLPNGLYFIKITLPNGQNETHRLIIQR